MRNTVRIAYAVALIFVIRRMYSGGSSGPVESIFLLLITVGGMIGVAVVEVMSYRREQRTQKSSASVEAKLPPATIATENETLQPAATTQNETLEPTWMGDAAGRKRRLIVILVILAVLAAGAIGFVLLGRQ